jgi:hypothetical protein
MVVSAKLTRRAKRAAAMSPHVPLDAMCTASPMRNSRLSSRLRRKEIQTLIEASRFGRESAPMLTALVA